MTPKPGQIPRTVSVALPKGLTSTAKGTSRGALQAIASFMY